LDVNKLAHYLVPTMYRIFRYKIHTYDIEFIKNKIDVGILFLRTIQPFENGEILLTNPMTPLDLEAMYVDYISKKLDWDE
jgi:hypothetical protein